MAFQVSFGKAGPTPTPPATLRARLLASVAAVRPGYTATLPASLIEDIASTEVGALTIIDQAAVDLVHSMGARISNPYLTNALGQMYGVSPGAQSNTSVFVVFTGTPGFVLGKGFIVGDGRYQYALSDGGVIKSDGQSSPLFAVATQSGIWSVPAGTVTQVVTSVPQGFSLSVVNPQPGIPGDDAETEASYRSRVLQAGKASAQGYFTMLKTLLADVDGVQPRLINAIPQNGGGWEILVGGGDPYEVAYAIYRSTQDISTLVGSTINVTDITKANPGVVSTDITHGYSVGQAIAIADVDPNVYNDDYTVLTVPSSTSFSLGKAFAANQLTALSWASTGGGEITGTTTSAHGVTVGSTFVLVGCVPTGYNGTYVAIAGTTGSTLVAAKVSDPGSATVLGQLSAGIANVNTSAFATYVSGGVVTPNFRNRSTDIVDYPNTYVIPFAVPPQQTVTMTVTWNTTAVNFVSEAAVAQAVAPAMAEYVNNITQGKPLNEMEMDDTFQLAVQGLLLPSQISRLVYSVSIDGVGVSPSVGTRLISGDPQSFLFALATGISVVQG
jgi:hypothetical protein